MIVLSNTAQQTIAVGSSLTFNTVILHTGTGQCYRSGTGSVKMKSNGVYQVHFSANVGGGTADTAVQLNLAVGGENLPQTTMISVPATATTQFNNVSCTTAIKNCCYDYDRITVVNTGTIPIIIDSNPVLYIRRVS